jgi:glycosyltransferase involved in cell wall biosynthesis
MRIALVATLATPVRRDGAGSVEGLVWTLARELTALGHEVTTFATGGSSAAGRVVSTLPGPSYHAEGAPSDWQVCEWINLCRAVEESSRFDVLHSHSYLYGLPLGRLSRAPMIHTFHLSGGEEYAALWRMYPEECVTAISTYQWSAFPDLRPAAVIPHGVDAAQFTYRAEPEDYVCFLGRFVPGKGPLKAIETARALGLRILLAGPRGDYYDERIAPLVDGSSVEYVGPVGGADRDGLLGGARALLYPVQDPEPFGLVMAEAMMCGTPVAAFRVGAVAEILDEGVTGCSVSPAEDLAGAVVPALALDRAEVRARALSRFSAEEMTREYAALYERVASDRRSIRSRW